MVCTHVTIGESWKCPVCHREELSTLRSRLAELQAEVERLTLANRAMNDAIDGDVFGAEVIRLKAEVDKLRIAETLALRERDEWKAKAGSLVKPYNALLKERDLARDDYAEESLQRMMAQERAEKAEKELRKAREALGNMCSAPASYCGQCDHFQICPRDKSTPSPTVNTGNKCRVEQEEVYGDNSPENYECGELATKKLKDKDGEVIDACDICAEELIDSGEYEVIPPSPAGEK